MSEISRLALLARDDGVGVALLARDDKGCRNGMVVGMGRVVGWRRVSGDGGTGVVLKHI